MLFKSAFEIGKTTKSADKCRFARARIPNDCLRFFPLNFGEINSRPDLVNMGFDVYRTLYDL